MKLLPTTPSLIGAILALNLLRLDAQIDFDSRVKSLRVSNAKPREAIESVISTASEGKPIAVIPSLVFVGPVPEAPLITVDLNDMSLFEAIQVICDSARLSCFVRGDALIVEAVASPGTKNTIMPVALGRKSLSLRRRTETRL